MFSLRMRNRNTGEVRYVRLSNDNTKAFATLDCVRASHFRSHVAAALVRDRATDAYPAFTVTVETCDCPTGHILAAQMRQP